MDYTPQRGDIVWLNSNPQVGREQAGRRPAVVLSPGSHNGKVGLLFACPITSQVKGYPFEVAVPAGMKIRGGPSVRSDKAFDWRGREIVFADRLPTSAINEVLAKISVLL